MSGCYNLLSQCWIQFCSIFKGTHYEIKSNTVLKRLIFCEADNRKTLRLSVVIKRILITNILVFNLLNISSNTVLAQDHVYWRGESPNGEWDWGTTCEPWVADGNWHYSTSENGYIKRLDCFTTHTINHFGNPKQLLMNLNSFFDFKVTRNEFESMGDRTNNTNASRSLYFSQNDGIAKIENNVALTSHTFNGNVNSNSGVWMGNNPINGCLVFNNNGGNTIHLWGLQQVTFAGNIMSEAGSSGLTINQSVRANFSGVPKTYCGTTTINSGATLQISSNRNLGSLTLNPGGKLIIDAGCTLTLSGTFTGGGTIENYGTIELTGPTLFPGSTTTVAAMNNLRINNLNGVTFNNAITISGQLILSEGIITTSATNLLTIANTSHLAISGGSSSSFINGPVTWRLPTNFAGGFTYTIPVGKGTTYMPMSIINPITGLANTTITAEGFTGNMGGTVGTNPGEVLTSLSKTEYWALQSSGSLINHSVSLTQPNAENSYNRIGRSTTLMGIYSSIGGTAAGNAITNSNNTGAGTSQFFVFAKGGPINVSGAQALSNGDFLTLKTAFDAINNQLQTGNSIMITVLGSTTEVSTAALYEGAWATLTIQPEGDGVRTISGSLIGTPIIDFNGADHVSIDGRISGMGSTKTLNIINLSSSDDANTSSIRFLNSAEYNSIRYCKIKGSQRNTLSGVVCFSTSTSGNGNNNNTLSYNEFSASATWPTNMVYSKATMEAENKNNSITYNEFFNFLYADVNSSGIFISDYNSSWIISGNSFSQSSTFEATGGAALSVIRIESNGDNFDISQNHIGGNSSQSTGTWLKTGDSSPFTAISFSTTSNGTNSIQNNTIRNFEWSNNDIDPWTGISIIEGNVTVQNNIIGNQTGLQSLWIKGSNNGGILTGISIAGSGNVNVVGNTIGSLYTENIETGKGLGIRCIYNSGAGNRLISNNYIGSILMAGSITASAYSNDAMIPQDVHGIQNNGSGNVTISGNSISNLVNNITLANPTFGQTSGIISTNGTCTITGNTLKNLTCISKNVEGAGIPIACIGIAVDNSAPLTQNINTNTIYAIGNQYNQVTAVLTAGIFFKGGLSQAILSKNHIHTINSSAASGNAEIDGIRISSGNALVSNNIISIGYGVSNGIIFKGIYENATTGPGSLFYHNTVALGGTAASGNSISSAFYSHSNSLASNIRNNIFYNGRTGSGSHYAAFFNYGAPPPTLDYNNYFAPGGGYLGYYSGSIVNSTPLISGQDANSQASSPAFVLYGGTGPADYIPGNPFNGATNTGITEDFNSTLRTCAHTMGAHEIEDTGEPPLFILGTTSIRCQSAGNVAYTASAINAISITYTLDVASLTAGNTINSTTGQVTYLAGWSGTSIITATATGCGVPVSSAHTVTILPSPETSSIYHD